MGYELRAVVAEKKQRRRVEAGELLRHRHYLRKHAAPPHPDRNANTAFLVDQKHEIEPMVVGHCVDLEVHHPHLRQILGLRTMHVAVRGPWPLLFCGGGQLETLLHPEPVQPLGIRRTALASGTLLAVPNGCIKTQSP